MTTRTKVQRPARTRQNNSPGLVRQSGQPISKAAELDPDQAIMQTLGQASPANLIESPAHQPLNAQRLIAFQALYGNAYVSRAITAQRQTDTDVEEDVAAAEAPGLSQSVYQEIEDLLKAKKRQDALDVLIDYLADNGQIDKALLTKGKMYYNGGLAGEGLSSPPGFKKDPVSGTWKAKPTPVQMGPVAFRKGIPWLYSSVMHEYQHVLQFQENVAKGTMGQRSLGWLIERQEVEAYAWELIHSKETGVFNDPKLMRENWRRLHAEHWMKLGKKSRTLLSDLYEQAHTIAQEAVGTSVTLPYKPATP